MFLLKTFGLNGPITIPAKLLVTIIRERQQVLDYELMSKCQDVGFAHFSRFTGLVVACRAVHKCFKDGIEFEAKAKQVAEARMVIIQRQNKEKEARRAQKKMRKHPGRCVAHLCRRNAPAACSQKKCGSCCSGPCPRHSRPPS